MKVLHTTPIGTLLLVSEHGALTECRLVTADHPCERHGPDDSIIAETRRQLDEYFEGHRRMFDLPLSPVGTEFQRSVWQALVDVPYGATATYRDIAMRINRPKASRAVGQAVGANPLLVIVPCHRIVASNGIGGFSAGIDIKIKLLAAEKVL